MSAMKKGGKSLPSWGAILVNNYTNKTAMGTVKNLKYGTVIENGWERLLEGVAFEQGPKG